ncbi:unnamed protein product [Adineta ricciae]|uniref:SAP domain-containing protein n=1 Tax=Adineta ricciae TaxID=249248 RepID=A0A815R471_ADIRI|nr:unnamed protein product [Adineta ricciae]CAF1472212.1 unnamed protein product [Adineta ricciae]
MAESDLAKQLNRIESMTNVELRAELKQRGCSTSGVKKDLLAKLRTALQKEYQDNSVGLTQNETSLPETVIPNHDQVNSSTVSQTVCISSVPVISISRVDVHSNVSPPAPRRNTRTSSRKSSAEQNNLEEKSHLFTVGISNDKSDTAIEDTRLSEEQNTQNDVSITPNENSEPTPSVQEKDQSTLPIADKQQEILKKDELSSIANESESAASQQSKQSRSQSAPFIKSYNRSTTNKINLSNELLKTFISDLSLLPESIANAELDASMNDDNIAPSSTSNGATLETNQDNFSSMTIGDLADGKQSISRTVVMDILNNNDDLSKRKQNSTATSSIADEPVRIKHALATDEPPSEILYIRGLTRPFSLLQLKELLGRYGTLIDGEFWLDKIKSQCFATYNTLEEAKHAREALDGCRWPSTNPKTLSIRYGRHEELQFSKTQDLPPDQMSVGENDAFVRLTHSSFLAIGSLDRVMQQQANASALKRSTSSVNETNPRSDDQESKKLKIAEPPHSGFLISEDEPEEETEIEAVPNNEASGKDLDDYFRKTKAKPSIYWLSLTEEQIVERDRQAERRRAEREANAALVEKKTHSKRKHSSPPFRRR